MPSNLTALKSIIVLCILFVPGIIWVFLSREYKSGYPPHSDTIFVIKSILYSFITYFIESILLFYWSYPEINLDNLSLNLDNLLSSPTKFIPYILLALPIAFFLSLADIAQHEHKLLSRVLRRIGVTKKFGNEDVWQYLLNSRTPGMEWVDVRDVENKIIYSGFIKCFSETEKTRELFLLEVIVYQADSVNINGECKELYRVPQMYISRPSESVIMEFRSITHKQDNG
ncbi:MAG: hypothetical protein H7707_03085 [Acetobacter sp.]|nr:hypothetical protein [Acetobacter sp.]